MALRSDVQLPSQPKAIQTEVERALRRASAACPAKEVWILTVLELPDQDEWLMLATGGVRKSEAESGWAFVTVDESGGEPICTYARVVGARERDPSVIGDAVQRLLSSVNLEEQGQRKNRGA